MMEDCYIEIWKDGKSVQGCEVVVVFHPKDESFYDELPHVEYLEDKTIIACLNYVKNQFPNGWFIEDGKILSSDF